MFDVDVELFMALQYTLELEQVHFNPTAAFKNEDQLALMHNESRNKACPTIKENFFNYKYLLHQCDIRKNNIISRNYIL